MTRLLARVFIPVVALDGGLMLSRWSEAPTTTISPEAPPSASNAPCQRASAVNAYYHGNLLGLLPTVTVNWPQAGQVDLVVCY